VVRRQETRGSLQVRPAACQFNEADLSSSSASSGLSLSSRSLEAESVSFFKASCSILSWMIRRSSSSSALPA
jgi:hypothetical protein